MGQLIGKLIAKFSWSRKSSFVEKAFVACSRSKSTLLAPSATPPRLSENREQKHIELPDNSWDSHMHVIGDTKQYPIAKSAVYTPAIHTLHDALSFESSIGVRTIVLVQPSIYGTDNSCLIDALRYLGPSRARGVVVINPNTDIVSLKSWHKLGVRGVRVNLKSVERRMSDEDFMNELQRYADIIRPLNWVLQLYIPMSTLPLLESIMDSLDVRICLDHFASPNLGKDEQLRETDNPYLLDGFASLIRLLDGGRTWVKISAAYRLANSSQDINTLGAMMKEFCHGDRSERIIWASDWPHTRFEGYNIQSFVQHCLEWSSTDELLRDRLFRDNANELWR